MKHSIAVNVRHEVDGRVTPLSIVWDDGRIFEVDKVLNVCRAASLKSGGAGIRYTCRIRNKQVYLFDEEGCWFFEAVG